MHFLNRKDAGKQLLSLLLSYRDSQSVVYALPRGGIILGFEVARELNLPLDLVITRKIGHPLNPEYAICAVTEKGELICDEAERLTSDSEWLKKAEDKERQEIIRRKKVYLGDLPHISPKGKTAIIVDDGVATGLTMRAAIRSIRQEQPSEIIVAIPVAPHDTLDILRQEADKVIILLDEKYFLGAIGSYYQDFPQISDQEVVDLMRKINLNQQRYV